MAFSLVQQQNNFNYSTGQMSFVMPGNITKGNLLVAWCISTDSSSSNHPTIDGGYDLTWIPVLSQTDTGGYGYLSVWYAIAKRSRAATILMYGSNGVGSVAANLTDPSGQIIEFSGNGTNPFVVSQDGSGTGATASVNLVASNSVGLVIGILVPTTAVADGVETTGWINTISTNTKAAAIYAVESTSGTFTPSFSLTNSGAWGILGVAFQIPGTTYTISGSLGSVGAGAQVLFASSTTQAYVTATADGNGNYTSPGLENDTYIVIPQVVGAYFSPYSASQAVNGANITGFNFTGTTVQTDVVLSQNWLDPMSGSENPLSGGGFWKNNGSPVPPWDYQLQVLDGEGTFSNTTIVANDAAPWKADAVSVFSGEITPPNDQWMQLQIDALNANPGTYATAFAEVRSSSQNTYCYRLAIQNNGDGTAQLSLIANYTNGTTQLPPYWEYSNGQQSYGATTTNIPFSLGDTIGLAVVGSVLYTYHNGTLVANFYDTDITSGTFCIELTGKSTSDVQVSNFQGGAASLMSVYNQLATDNFTRAAESPLSDGGNWAVPDATNYLVLTASQEVNGATNNVCAQYFNGGITWPNDQYAEVTLTGGITGATAVGPTLRWQSGTRNGYGILFFPSPPTNFIIQSYVSGVGTNIATANVTYTAGDVIRLEIVGTALTGIHNGTVVASGTDSTYTAGFPGLLTLNDLLTVGFSGPFNAGSIVTTTGLVITPSSVTYPGTATGTVTISAVQPDNVSIPLSSSDATIATVPASVTVIAGQTTANFTITSVNKTGSATITAGTSTAGISVTASSGNTSGQGTNLASPHALKQLQKLQSLNF